MKPFRASELTETQAHSLCHLLVPNSDFLTKRTEQIRSFDKQSFLISKGFPQSRGEARHTISGAAGENKNHPDSLLQRMSPLLTDIAKLENVILFPHLQSQKGPQVLLQFVVASVCLYQRLTEAY